MSSVSTVFTVGHASLSAHRFRELIAGAGIETVIDVRSSPHSRVAPQFERAALERWLPTAGVNYVFAGRALGGRPRSLVYYTDGQVDYSKIAVAKPFLAAVARIVRIAGQSRIALMCAEADPLRCHRALLIGRALDDCGVRVVHLVDNGRLEEHDVLKERLLRAIGVHQDDLFVHPERRLAEAYAVQGRSVAYRSPAEDQGA